MKRYSFLILILSALFLIPEGCRERTVMEEEIIIKEHTRVPEENPDLLKVEVQGDTLLKLIYKAGVSKPTFSAGDVVVGTKDGGYLHKVVSQKISADTVILHTEWASLTDAIERGGFDTTVTLKPSPHTLKPIKIDTSFKEKGKLYHLKATSKEPILTIQEKGFVKEWPDLKIILDRNGKNIASLYIERLRLIADLRFHIGDTIDDSEVSKFVCVVEGSDSLQFVGVNFTVKEIFSLSSDILPLPSFILTSFVIPIGWIPVLITVNFEPCLGFSANSTLSKGITLKNELALGLNFSLGGEYYEGSWHKVWNKKLGGDGTLELSIPAQNAKVELKAYLKNTFNLKVYHSIGGGIFVRPYLYNDIFIPPPTDTLGIGVDGGLSFILGILGWNLAEWDWTLLDYHVPLYTWSGPSNHPPNIPPPPSGPSSGDVGTSYTFSTSAIDPDTDDVTIIFDWGDGKRDTSSYVSSGDTVSMSHSYSSEGTYYVKAKAKDSKGDESNWSNGHSIKISKGNHPPYTPSNPSPPDGATDQPTSLTLSWKGGDPDGDKVTYDLYFGTSPSPPLKAPDLTSTSYSISGLSNNTTYYWKIIAEDEHGETAEGDVWSFTTKAGAIIDTLKNDDGTPEYVFNDVDYYASKFSPSSECILQKIVIGFTVPLDSSFVPQICSLFVWDDLNGIPGNRLLVGAFDIPTVSPGKLVLAYVDVSGFNLDLDSDFWAGYKKISLRPPFGVADGSSSPPNRNMWRSTPSESWESWTDGDFMIRAVVKYGSYKIASWEIKEPFSETLLNTRAVSLDASNYPKVMFIFGKKRR